VRTLIELTEDEWFEQFKPVKNILDPNASFDGHMFETYAHELDFIKAQQEDRIWTYADGDNGGTYIWSGMRVINRIGYFITSTPFSQKFDYQIKVMEPDSCEHVYESYCPKCGIDS